jgi:hypothetical protein
MGQTMALAQREDRASVAAADAQVDVAHRALVRAAVEPPTGDDPLHGDRWDALGVERSEHAGEGELCPSSSRCELDGVERSAARVGEAHRCWRSSAQMLNAKGGSCYHRT